MDVDSVDVPFAGKEPQVRVIYDRLVAALHQFGEMTEAPKQTSVHLEKNSGFAGVHPRKNYINLEFRTDYLIDNPRIVKHQQLSTRRYEHTIQLRQESDVDEQLLAWLKDAYELSK